MFEVGFVPCLRLIWCSKLGRGCRVNETFPGRFLVKNSTNGGKGELWHATTCNNMPQRVAGKLLPCYSVAQHAMAWGHRRHFLFCLPPTSNGYNFFVRTPFQVFLDSMKSPLSEESIHMHVEGNWCPQPC